MLNNTYYKLTAKNSLTVAYFGGSITVGFNSFAKAEGREPTYKANEHSWRALTTKWLKEQFPKADIREINGSIGGTGTIFGAHRAVKHLDLETTQPDLVFVEFTINDRSENPRIIDDCKMYMESVINTIYQYAPKADIVMVFTGSYTTMSSGVFSTKIAHKEVADFYHIPTIDVAAQLWSEMVEKNNGVSPLWNSSPDNPKTDIWWTYFSDSAHPAAAGYEKYAEYVKAYLKNVFDTKTSVSTEVVNSYKPSTTLTMLPINPRVANLAGKTAPSDITVTEQNNGVYSIPAGAFSFNGNEGEVTVEFCGTDLMLWIKNGPGGIGQTGTLSVTIDGVLQEETLEFKASNHTALRIASGLADQKHVVTLKMETETGVPNVYICWFMMSGGSGGVTLTQNNKK